MNKNVILNVRSDAPIKIMESRTEGSDLYLVGEFTTFDVLNRNKRIYKKDNYKVVLEQIAEKCASGALLGELGHPNGRSNTELDCVSHVITKLEIDEEKNCVRGELKLLPTPKGQLARTLVENGVPLFVSSRASGYIGKGGVVTLTSLITYDLVDEPGFANARLTVRDITEGLCSECDDPECVAIFDPEGSTEAPSVQAQPAVPSSDPVVVDALNKLAAEVKALSDRVAACETKCASAGGTDAAVSQTAVQSIIDSKIAEAIEELRNDIYKMDERRIAADSFRELQESDADRNSRQLIDYINYVVEECNKHEAYMDYAAEQYNNEMKKVCEHLDYTSNAINGGGAGSNGARIDIIEKYLEEISLEFSKNEKIMNEKFNKFIDYTDYIAKTINENNEEVRMFQEYIDEEVFPAVEKTIDESRAFRKEIIANVHNFNKVHRDMEAMDTRIKLFTESVGDRLDAVKILNNESEMNDVKRLLMNIQSREDAEKQKIQANAQTQSNNLFLEREEKRLRSFMHPSVVHIWESFDDPTKMKIANDMSVSKCLALQTQSLLLTRMIHNCNAK